MTFAICKRRKQACALQGFLLIAFSVLFAGAAILSGTESLSRSFANPPDDCRIMMRWWWFGPAVARPELEREMKLMKEGGVGGFEVQPVYPLALDDPGAGIKNLPFLSGDFLDALRFTSDKARELGLRMDLTLGSGWPFGGPQVSVRDAAGKLRIVRLSIPNGTRRLPLPDIRTGEKFLAAFLHIDDRIREVTAIDDGALSIPETVQGSPEVLFFISGRTGMMVKRPAVGAEGFVLNHYDRTAVDGYLRNVGDRLLRALDPNPPYAIFCDSLEVFESDWTDDFLEEFQRRRGYDLKPYLPFLVLDLGPKSADIRCDWGRTLTELFNERFMVPMHEWSRRNHTLFRVQGYGIPPAAIASNAYADISEGEGSQWKTMSASRWASSANHLFGRPVTTSETWTWLHSPVFRATPLDMKAEANLHFLQGINQLIGHGWPYSPERVEYPGWRFYAAGVFNEKNPWWIVIPDVAKYLQRTSYLLRQGQPVNDIAFYLPVSDAYAGFSPGRVNLIDSLRNRVGTDVLSAVLEAGFNFDFFDDEVLRQMGRIEKGALALGSNRYRAVVLPNVERVPPETRQMLDRFVSSGGVLIASRRRPAIVAESALADSGRFLFVEDEKNQLAAALRRMLQPDVEFSPRTPEIGFVHRKTRDVEIYFLANTSDTRRIAQASFRVSHMNAEWWDPMSGKISPASISAGRDGTTSVALDLEPYAGRFLIFSKRRVEVPAEAKASDAVALDLSKGWCVTFGAGGLSKKMDQLSSWTDDEATRYFSGIAIYEKTVRISESMLRPGARLRLGLGKVMEAAVVFVNDVRAGSVWCPPYEIDVTSLLRRGDNRIRILVANTAINQMSGKPLPDYRLLNQRYGKRFDPQDMDKMKPIESGLLGPVMIY